MPASTPRELMVLVERVVRPLPIPLVRQKRLRAEFLEHLLTLYAEEFGRDQDVSAAIARTANRFGDPEELSAELRATISCSARIETWLGTRLHQRYGESICGYLVRFLGGFLMFFLPLIGLVVLTKHLSGAEPFSRMEARLVTGLATFLTAWLGGTLGFGLLLGQAWEQSRRNYFRLAVTLIGMLATCPFSFLLLMAMAGSDLSALGNQKLSGEMILAGTSLVTLILGVFFGIAHRRETAYRDQWAELVLD